MIAAFAPRQAGSRLALFALTLAGLIALYIALLATTLALTDDRAIEANLRQSFASGVLGAQDYPVSPFGDRGHRYDMFSECVGLGLSHGDADQSLFARLVTSNFVARPGVAAFNIQHPCDMLAEALKAGDLHASADYFRFWHGYQIVLRPIIAAFGYESLRKFNALALYGALAFLAFSAAPLVGGWGAAWIILGAALTGDYFTAPLVTVHALPLAWIFFSAGLVFRLLASDRESLRRATPLLVFAAGSLTNFISFFFNPPLAPTLIAFAALACAARQGRLDWRAQAGALTLASLWFGGFFLTWIAKWALAVPVLGSDYVAQNLAMAFSAKYYLAYKADQIHQLLAPSMILLMEPNAHIARYFLISAASALTVLFICARQAGTRGARAPLLTWLALQSPLLIVLAWVEYFNVHSVEHRPFVTRDFLPLVLFPLLGALVLQRRAAPEPETEAAPLAAEPALASTTRS